MLVSFYQFDTNQDAFRERFSTLELIPSHWAWRDGFAFIFSIDNFYRMARPTVGGTIPWLVGLGLYLPEPRGEANKQGSSMSSVSSSCLEFLSWLPLMVDCHQKPNKPLSPPARFRPVWYHSNGKQTEIVNILLILFAFS